MPNAFVNHVVVPADESQCTNCGHGFNFSVGLSSISPNVGDAYGLQVTYSDGTSEAFTPTVGAVLNAFAANLAPITGGGTSTTLTFTWLDPANASSYTYSFYMNDSTGTTVWQIPGNNSKSNGFSSSITSIVWGIDPTGGGSTPSVGSLTTSTTYNWQIQVQDSNGNSTVQQVSYQP